MCGPQHCLANAAQSEAGLFACGVSGDATRPDNIVYDIVTLPGLPIGVSPSGWGHATCNATATAISKTLPVIP